MIRNEKLEESLPSTRIIFRTTMMEISRPRQVCALQDAFIDDDGLAVVYEISVRHRRVRGEPNHVTAEVLLMAHAARPIKGSPERSMLVVVSQIDARLVSIMHFTRPPQISPT